MSKAGGIDGALRQSNVSYKYCPNTCYMHNGKEKEKETEEDKLINSRGS
jgi:hypothetical protein